jgi:hypothetical protein
MQWTCLRCKTWNQPVIRAWYTPLRFEIHFFSAVLQPNWCLGRLIVEVSRSHDYTHTHARTQSRTPSRKSDRRVARDATYATHNTRKSKPLLCFDPAIQRLKLYALDGTTAGLDWSYKFIHSIGMCRMRRFLAVLWELLPSSLTSSYHLLLGLPLGLVDSKFTYNNIMGILFPSILKLKSLLHNCYFTK